MINRWIQGLGVAGCCLVLLAGQAALATEEEIPEADPMTPEIQDHSDALPAGEEADGASGEDETGPGFGDGGEAMPGAGDSDRATSLQELHEREEESDTEPEGRVIPEEDEEQ